MRSVRVRCVGGKHADSGGIQGFHWDHVFSLSGLMEMITARHKEFAPGVAI
jgi:hypothetical protein